MSILHDCKRGLTTATPTDYNRWWRERRNNRDRIAELERLLRDEVLKCAGRDLGICPQCRESINEALGDKP